MVKKENIAIIPARGGSKRIPKKNIINFYNKPMIAWTIQAAQNSKIFDRIFVSTDDIEIAETSQKFGIDLPFLRDNFSDDNSTVSQVIIYTLNQIKEKLNETYETVTLLMPNCPLRTFDDIKKTHENFDKQKNIFQLSCFKFGFMNPWWALKLKNNLAPEYIFPEALKKRSQDLDELYCPTGAIWIAKTNDLITQKTFYGNPTTFFPIDWKSAIDIDNYEDLEMAQAIFLLKNNIFNNINYTKNISIF